MFKSNRVPAYSAREFEELMRASPKALMSHPCVIKGFTGNWSASREWTDLAYLAEQFGHHEVTASAPQFTTHKEARICQVRTDYRTYLKYIESPEEVESIFQNRWTQGNADELRKLNLPLYCGNVPLVRHTADKLFGEIAPVLPEPLECVNDEIPFYYQSGNHVWLYVSIAGALTPLHQDNNAVCAYLAQLQGHKEAILYPPEDKRHYYNPTVGYMNPLSPDSREFPTWMEARQWTASLAPGDLLVWGSNWAHHVVTLDRSITVSFDFVNSDNLDAYSKSIDWRFKLGSFAKRNEKLVRQRIIDGRVSQALIDGKEEPIGKEMMISVLRSALNGHLSERSRYVKQNMLVALEA